MGQKDKLYKDLEHKTILLNNLEKEFTDFKKLAQKVDKVNEQLVKDIQFWEAEHKHSQQNYENARLFIHTLIARSWWMRLLQIFEKNHIDFDQIRLHIDEERKMSPYFKEFTCKKVIHRFINKVKGKPVTDSIPLCPLPTDKKTA